MQQKRQDKYIANPALLNGKPKETIGRYVKQNGILVPEIYDSLWDARRSGKPLIARSESEQEYSGASGICESLKINNNNGNLVWGQILLYRRQIGYSEIYPSPTSESSIRSAILISSLDSMERHASLKGLDLGKQLGKTSFSLWERMLGWNIKILGDPAIEAKYHVTVLGRSADATGFATFDNGKITIHNAENIGDFFKDQKNRLVELYEMVCSLENFDPSHRPVIEAQLTDGKLYFLQYHRCRDFRPAEFVLDRPKMKGEIEARFVRGATPAEGLVAKTTLYYRDTDCKLVTEAPDEEGAFSTYSDPVFANTFAGKRKLQIIVNRKFEHDCSGIATSHDPYSLFAKPEVSVFALKSSFPQLAYSKLPFTGSIANTYRSFREALLPKGMNVQLQVRVVSDGNKAYFQVLESELATNVSKALGYPFAMWETRNQLSLHLQFALETGIEKISKFFAKAADKPDS